MSHFQGPTPLGRRDQCAPFEPLVDPIGKGPPTAGQSGLSGLVVGGPKTYDTMVQDYPEINTSQDPTLKIMTTKLPSYKIWTRRKPLVSATTGSNLEHQRMVIRKVMQAHTKLYE